MNGMLLRCCVDLDGKVDVDEDMMCTSFSLGLCPRACTGIVAVIYLSGTFDVPERPKTEDALKEFSASNARRGVQAVVSVFLGKHQSVMIYRTARYCQTCCCT